MMETNEGMEQKLRAIVQEIEKGPIELLPGELLCDMLETVQDELNNLSMQLSSELFALIWFLKVFFVDNLFENSIIEEKGIPLKRGRSLLDEITYNTRWLIARVLNGDGTIIDFMYAGEMLQAYYKLVEVCSSDDSSDRIHF